MSEHISMPTDNDPYPTDPHNAKNETQLPEYTQLARLGRTSWQRQVAAIATILFFWLVLGAAAALAVMGSRREATTSPHPRRPHTSRSTSARWRC
jgi:hypothetical protein